MAKWMQGVGLVVMLGMVMGLSPVAGSPVKVIAAAQGGVTLAPESNDFATRVLGDPWDMSTLSDVSAYLNDSGQRANLQNIQDSNGVFSATSTSSADANFALLFPGYQNAIKTGKDGAINPIDSSQYHCLYFALYVHPDVFNQAQIFWFGDETLNAGRYWGESRGISLASNAWSLYHVDLATLPLFDGTAVWAARSTWEGLRLDPTNQRNTSFQVDWARLTDCHADNVTISWQPNGSVSAMRLRPAGTTRDILVKSNLSGNSTTLDVQGVQPGTYTVRLFDSGGGYVEDAANTLEINQAPIASFLRPSYTSGTDYAAQNGNPWDFSDAADVQSAPGMQSSLHDSLLDMITQSGPAPNIADPQIFLNRPQPVSGATYRYLSFRMDTEWAAPWQNVPDGMIVRWIWGIQGVGGPTFGCFLVSHDIPFDVGWHVYNIDLWDPYNGTPLYTDGACPGNIPTWSTSPPMNLLRFDPNENVTVERDPLPFGGPFHQYLDWIKLTAIDQVSQGTPYELQVHLNRPAGDVTGVTYYYTTDRSQPTQSVARRYTARNISGPFHIHLPAFLAIGGAAATGDTFPSADLIFMWDTAPVNPNTYYLCTVVSISPNTATYCSDTPIQVN